MPAPHGGAVAFNQLDALSILYLRCLFVAALYGATVTAASFNSLFEMLPWRSDAVDIGGWCSFNSLFEMRRILAWWRGGWLAGLLSILYLRCSGGWAAGGCRVTQALSILYLRCPPQPPPQSPASSQKAFNSLFEMQRAVLVLRERQWENSFNSLFEMPSSLSRPAR